ncbi:SPOR domain-containing protein [Pseudolysobacter antarcticus]|uniref:SPOR domain-containing protein n=1 Tax=Pseudolysobacter antarcticus TaxID=2511995 RepID=A0A411HLH8_9GAMM|nr:SPOR domain-containing protein [Pseudolysobacter antarcticus]QBB71375.1 SPOR domain-containing protein [Pseudolysobacter antarcticus]
MDSGLKQRLLGAAVLIALAVIFVPMFLSGPPPKQSSETVSLDIPNAPERKFETRTLPLAVPNASAPASTAPVVPITTAPAAIPDSNRVATVDTHAPPRTDAAPETNATPAKPATSPAVATAVTPASAAVKPATPAATAVAENGRFTVNLGIYADRAHADALVQNIKKLGLPVVVEATEYQGKPGQRVRVGPFADRASAEAARLKIKASDAKLPLSISETASAPATSDTPVAALPANKAGGWAVQLGAFKSEDEANKLRQRCMTAGFVAFVDRSGSAEQALWRVRAGPEADRGNADKLRTSLKQKLQLDGIVVTQP